MRPILSAAEMKKCDIATTEIHHIPSLVLMERAAESVVDYVNKMYSIGDRIYVLCGPGNNGGDGVAIGRMLHLQGYYSKIVLLGAEEKYSTQLREQVEIARSYGAEIVTRIDEEDLSKADVFVDALFGIGLTRGLSGEYELAACIVNKSNKPVIAVDIPSGYDTDCGKLLGNVGVQAETTITFAYMKKGLLLGECKAAAGNILVADVGIYVDEKSETYSQLLDESILNELPQRAVTANKGSCGKLLIIAGSENIYGACYLAAKAALTVGAGLAKIFTHKNNIYSIQQALPEAMYYGYEEYEEDELIKDINWADVILIGPGLGMGDVSKKILETVLIHTDTPVVIDADAINLCGLNISLLKQASEGREIILTPHLKEMERLCNRPVSDINYEMENIASTFVKENNVTLVLKNYTSVIATKRGTYYSASGNEGLATPGAGDVLAGIISGLVAQGLSVELAAEIGTFLHGQCGEKASKKVGIKAVLASDIIEELKK